jgi:hypothetical protein
VGRGWDVAPDRAGRRNPAAVAHPLLKKTASADAAGFVSLKTTEAARPRDGFSRNIEDKAAIGRSLLKELFPRRWQLANSYQNFHRGLCANRVLIYRIFVEHFRRLHGKI